MQILRESINVFKRSKNATKIHSKSRDSQIAQLLSLASRLKSKLHKLAIIFALIFGSTNLALAESSGGFIGIGIGYGGNNVRTNYSCAGNNCGGAVGINESIFLVAWIMAFWWATSSFSRLNLDCDIMLV